MSHPLAGAPSPAPLSPGPPSPRRTALLLAALALTVAFLDLGSRSLHDLDVPRWGTLARETLETGDWLVPSRYGEVYANKPPLYLWIVTGLSALHGEVTPFLLRLPSALGLVLVVLLTAAFARDRTGSRRVSLVAGLLALSTFGLVWLGREARMDLMAGALSLGGAYAWDRLARGEGGRSLPWGAGLVLGLALLTKGPVLLLVPVAVLLLGEPGRPRRARIRAARVPTVLGVAFAVALAWFVPAWIEGGPEFARTLLVDQTAERLTGTSSHTEPVWYYLVSLPVAGLPWGPALLAVAGASAFPRAARALGPLRGLVQAGAAVLVLFSLFPTKHFRYLAPVLPLLLLGLAAVLERWLAAPRRADWARVRRALGPALLLAAAAVAALGATCLFPTAAVAVPAALLAVVGAAVLASGRADAGDARATVLLGGLLAAVALTSATTVLRPRFRLRDNVWFNLEVARHVPPGEPVFTLEPLRPEDLFDGAPKARAARTPADLAAADAPRPFVVVAAPGDLGALDRALGGGGRPLFPPRPGHDRVAVIYDRPAGP